MSISERITEAELGEIEAKALPRQRMLSGSLLWCVAEVRRLRGLIVDTVNIYPGQEPYPSAIGFARLVSEVIAIREETLPDEEPFEPDPDRQREEREDLDRFLREEEDREHGK